MDDKTCQNCGAPLVVRSSQIVQLPGETPKCYVDYDCPSVGCEGSIRVMTMSSGPGGAWQDTGTRRSEARGLDPSKGIVIEPGDDDS